MLISDIGDRCNCPAFQKRRQNKLGMKYIDLVLFDLRRQGERDPSIWASRSNSLNLEITSVQPLQGGESSTCTVQHVLIVAIHLQQCLGQRTVISLIPPLSAANTVNIDADLHGVQPFFVCETAPSYLAIQFGSRLQGAHT